MLAEKLRDILVMPPGRLVAYLRENIIFQYRQILSIWWWMKPIAFFDSPIKVGCLWFLHLRVKGCHGR